MRLTIRQRQRSTRVFATQPTDATHGNARQPANATHWNATQLTDATHTNAAQQGISGNATHWNTTSGTRITRQRATPSFMQSVQPQAVDNLCSCTSSAPPCNKLKKLEGSMNVAGGALLTNRLFSLRSRSEPI